MALHLDEWIEKVKGCKYLEEKELKALCEYVKDLLLEESNVQPISAPVAVCGDIHGQFYDLLQLFSVGGELPDQSYIFMGDYVDRGSYSVETFTYLMLLKARYPDKVTLLRGNHETRQITQVYGFYDECVTKYGSANAWKYCIAVFDLLGIAALIEDSIFCVHGGLSPNAQTMDQIRQITRDIEVPIEGALCDFMWSDPEDIEGWESSPRGGGWLFGTRPTREFVELNQFSLIARAHQLVADGYCYKFNQQLVTVWSAPNYCNRGGNLASIMKVDSNVKREFITFDTVLASSLPVPQIPQYFL